MMNKILVIHSGGLDSTVLLYKAISIVGKSNVYTLSFNYGQKHQIELEMRRWHQDHLGLKDSQCLVLDIANIFGWDKASALLGHAEVAHESYDEQLKHTEVVSAYVPYRNGTLLSIAASIAYSLGCDTVAYGAHADDAVRRHNGQGAAAYPDCTKQFIEAQSRAIMEGTGGKVSLWAPLGDLTKAEVVGFGLDACMTKEEFEHTHSCYEGTPGGCGTCGTCIDREKALDTYDETRGCGQSGIARPQGHPIYNRQTETFD